MMGGSTSAAEGKKGGPSLVEGLPSDGSHTLVPFEDILDGTLEGLVAPFTNRVKQVLESQAAIVVVYKIAQVFTFFAKTLEEVLKKKEICLVTMCKNLYS